jgi:hypothetical protein
VRPYHSPNAGPGRFSAYPGDPHEAHYSVQQVAEEWGVDAETVRRTFIDEEGVLILGDQLRRNGKRAYLTIRIPESVLKRVYSERTTRKFHGPRTRSTRNSAAGKKGQQSDRTA